MISLAPCTGRSPARWALHDSLEVARRYLTHFRQQPSRLIGNLLFPIVMVLMFGYVFGSAIVLPDGGNYREFLMPGLFVMTMALGMAQTVISVTTDTAKGITDRFRTIPMSDAAVVAGRSLADLVASVLDLIVLLACGLLVGWRANGTGWQTIAAIGLLLLLRYALAWVGIYLGLTLRSPELAGVALAPIYPLTMISNTFVLPDQMPAWLGAIAEWNPLSATVTATRELFGNPGVTTPTSWAAENALSLAIAWPIVLIAVFLPLAALRYRHLAK
ncbi:ABC transporter permease [Actinoalloteichus hymeniacidonis]|uniref:Transport permease protein n=1 Tax=Actinoalloteichus hymeniacidonis TaxID=340345 RepID=A0AAC9MYF6_9PSEU|nr:ABC transporter permease [Actinoalloteichus hymeniacidonis]AOS63210.1 ABC-type multidrug transport system, permease component [Actinoalloteichus hymeniacidonis]MBB5908753.1 ABC transporter DrrB family efflux protein [Actinoalloteichus hymeniacidonis]